MRYKPLIFASLLSTIGVNAQAQQAEHEEDDQHFSMGLFVSSEQSLYLGGKSETQVIPLIQFQSGRYFLQGPSLGAYLYQSQNWRLSASVNLSGFGDDNRDDSVELADMQELDSAFLATTTLEYENDWGELALSAGYDVSGTHDGSKFALSYTYPFMAGGWRISPELSFEWASEEISQYYYGVSQLDVRPDRPLYTPDAYTSYEVGVSAMYPFKRRHALMIRAGYQGYSKEVTDSPIVDADGNTSVAIGYLYRF